MNLTSTGVGRLVSTNAATPALQEKPTKLAIASCCIVAAYLVLKMFYVLGSGGAQPADVALAALALLVVSPKRMLAFMRQYTVYLLFLIWVIVINAVWSAIYVRLDFMLSASYYIFNAFILITVYTIRYQSPDYFDRVIIVGLRVSIFIQLLFLLGGFSGRAVGTFNNPNQLAYWAVAVSSIYLLIRRHSTRWSDLPFLLGAAYACLSSLSRSGTISVVAMLILWFWMALETPKRRLMGAMVGMLLALSLLQGVDINQLVSGGSTLSSFETRIEQRQGENVTEVRNWDRISQYYKYNILGAGEGYFRRFESSRVLAIEIHSSFATLLFSYGIVGLGLFLAFLFRCVRKIPWSLSVYLIPSLIYGITHQGLRFSFFWLLIGIMCSMGDLTQYGRSVHSQRKLRSASSKRLVTQNWRPRGPHELRQQ